MFFFVVFRLATNNPLTVVVNGFDRSRHTPICCLSAIRLHQISSHFTCNTLVEVAILFWGHSYSKYQPTNVVGNDLLHVTSLEMCANTWPTENGVMSLPHSLANSLYYVKIWKSRKCRDELVKSIGTR